MALKEWERGSKKVYLKFHPIIFYYHLALIKSSLPHLSGDYIVNIKREIIWKGTISRHKH
jgi:hypothetical protein